MTKDLLRDDGSRTSSEVASASLASTRRAAGTIAQGGRAKAYRPIPLDLRRAALAAAVAAWERGDWFETHELLEPAWMGADDPAERDLYQGLIKLAAAYVHRSRGNGLGLARNLAGAHDRLARVAAGRGTEQGVKVNLLLAEVWRRLPADGGPADMGPEPPAIQILEVP